MRYCVFVLLSFVCCTAYGADNTSTYKKNLDVISDKIKGNLTTKPVNNTPVLPPFPIANKDANVWDIKLREYIYAYQNRYGNIGDRFILPQDMDAFLQTLPHGTTDKPIIDPKKQDDIAITFDDQYEQNTVDQYFRMQYRVMAETMR